MSRLDSMIRRLEAQRACLDWAAAEVAGLPGPVLELGLGNGRTYDHLRERFPDREIFVFDRQVNAHPGCVPDDDHLFLGNVQETLRRAADRLGRAAALLHNDIGTGDAARNARLASRIGPLIADLVRPGGIILSDQQLPVALNWQEIATPDGVAAGRYCLYRVAT
ncbi:MAG: class I SAM-dependent methyltransferase [Alphaproteobacteria bacterium]|nr:class I SAM-dependent methyltransferase [Alphaproteobacteria bacterium]